MKSKLLVLFAFSILFFSNCKREVTCPAFKNSDLQYIAYNENDSLVFEFNQTDMPLKYIIHIKEISPSESFVQKCKRDLYNQCPCINSVSVTAENSEDSSSFVFLKMEQSDVSEMQVFKYHIKDFNFEIDFDNELPYSSDIPYMEYIPSLEINGITYTKVAIITNLDNLSSNILKVYLNKANGIFAFQDKSLNTWNLSAE